MSGVTKEQSDALIRIWKLYCEMEPYRNGYYHFTRPNKTAPIPGDKIESWKRTIREAAEELK